MVEELTQPWYFFGEYNQDGKNLLEVLGVTREQFRFIQQNDMYSFEFRTYKKMLSQKNVRYRKTSAVSVNSMSVISV